MFPISSGLHIFISYDKTIIYTDCVFVRPKCLFVPFFYSCKFFFFILYRVMAHLLAMAASNNSHKTKKIVDIFSLNPYVHEWIVKFKILRKFEYFCGGSPLLGFILVDETVNFSLSYGL